MKHSFARSLFPSVALMLAALTSPLALAGPYDSLVVFGDSLSDDGNNFAAGLYDPTQIITDNSYIPTYTYASHVYSNGPVWATDFASLIGVSLAPSLTGGTDYAFGGATTGPAGSSFPYSLLDQTAMYVAGAGSVSANSLFVVAGGGNDARAALVAIQGGADPTTTITNEAISFATNIGTIVTELQNKGAQHIIVWDTPNLGLAPAVASDGPVVADGASFLAASMNSALTSALAGRGVSIFDIYGLGTTIAADPAAYGFSNVSDACGAVTGANCDQYAYWDGIHPTAATHEIIANSMLAVAAPIPEPETWLLMLIGMFSIGWAAKRRAIRPSTSSRQLQD